MSHEPFTSTYTLLSSSQKSEILAKISVFVRCVGGAEAGPVVVADALCGRVACALAPPLPKDSMTA
jgi:hypothetical protein